MERIIQKAHVFESAINSVMQGQQEVVRKVLATMFAGGHVLLEDHPGTGKTTLAKTLAKAISGAIFKRVQFTPDLLPSDILGISIFNPKDQEFSFHQGPIFGDIILADEINRASPRTQSALLEAMGERQVTIEGNKYVLDGVFFVIATQNPVEFRGTYPLPEAQMDRFSLQCSLGYVKQDEEVNILEHQLFHHPLDQLAEALSKEEILEIMIAVKQVRFTRELMNYVVKLVSATRLKPEIQLPASTRASLAMMQVSQAIAFLNGSDFVTPEHIKEIAVDVMAHRIVLTPESKYSGMTARLMVESIIQEIPVPA